MKQIISMLCLFAATCPAYGQQQQRVPPFLEYPPPGTTTGSGVVQPRFETHSGSGTSVTRNMLEVDQLVIPRDADPGFVHPGGDKVYGPAGGLYGWGPHSAVRGTVNTQNQAIPYVVITEGAGSSPTAMNKWSDGVGSVPAVMSAQLRDIAIVGPDTSGDDYSNHGGANHFAGSNSSKQIDGAIGGTQWPIESASRGTGGAPVRIEMIGTGIADAAAVMVSGFSGNDTDVNGVRYVGKILAHEYDLYSDPALSTAVTGDGSYSLTSPQVTQLTSRTITTASGTSPIVVNTSGAHGLIDSAQVTISGADAEINGTHFVDVIDTDTVHLYQESSLSTPVTGDGTYAAGGSIAILGVSNGSPMILYSPGHDMAFVYAGADKELDIAGVLGNTAANSATGTITAASNTSPISVTSAGHGLSDGDRVRVVGVLGNTAANGLWDVTNAATDTFDLLGSTGSGTYTSGGTWHRQFAFTAPATFGTPWMTLTGTSGTGNWTGGGAWHSEVWGDRQGGAYIQSTGAQLQNVTFAHHAGTALTMSRGEANVSGSKRWYDGLKQRLGGITILNCHRGIDYNVIDGTIEGMIEIKELRDYGLKLHSSTMVSGAVHGWSINSGSPILAPILWVPDTVGGVMGGPWYFDSSALGALIEGNQCNLHTILCFNVSVVGLQIDGARNTVRGLQVAAPTGLQRLVADLGGERNQILGGRIIVGGGEMGINLTTASEHRIQQVDLQNPSGATNDKTVFIHATATDMARNVIDVQLRGGSLGIDLSAVTGDKEQNSIKVTTGFNIPTEVLRLNSTWTRASLLHEDTTNEANWIVVDNVQVMGAITNVTSADPIVVTSAGHGLRVGDRIVVRDTMATNGTIMNGVTGVKAITAVTTDTFTYAGDSTAETYEPGTGWWGMHLGSHQTGSGGTGPDWIHDTEQ